MKKRCLNKLLVMTMAAAIGFGTGGRYITVYAEENATYNDIEADDGIMPCDVIAKKFISYKPNQKKHVNKYKQIARISFKNDTPNEQKHTFSITESEETTGNINAGFSFTASFEAGILAGAEASVGISLDFSKARNSAKGYSVECVASPHTIQTLIAYNGAWKTYGILKYASFDTAAPDNKIYLEKEIDTVFFQKTGWDIYTDLTEKAI